MLPMVYDILLSIIVILTFIIITHPWQTIQYNLYIPQNDGMIKYECNGFDNKSIKYCYEKEEYIYKPEKFKHFEPDEAEKEASNSYKTVPYVPKKYNIQTLIPTRTIV